MNRTGLRAGLSVLALTGALGLAGPPGPASAAGGERVPLLGPEGNLHCITGVTEVQADLLGHVIIRQSGTAAVAHISIRNAEPRTLYFARLVQVTPDGVDCHAGFFPFTTNAAGTAQVRLREALLPNTTGLNVAVNAGAEFGSPHYVGSETVPIAE